jgi:hypothetical protein
MMADTQTNQTTISGVGVLSRTGIFFYDLAVLAILAALCICYLRFPNILAIGPQSLKFSAEKLAIECMWFGSLGGVIISLKGIYDHSKGKEAWDGAYDLWHLGRPISGAAAGLMTVVLLKVLNSTDPQQPVAYAAAFIFGTQEKRFFNFLYEVAKLIVQVPDEAKTTGLGLTGIQPSTGSAGDLFVISGHGIDPKATVKLGTADVVKPIISTDGTTVAGVIPAGPAAGGAVDVIVTNAVDKSATLAGKFSYPAPATATPAGAIPAGAAPALGA